MGPVLYGGWLFLSRLPTMSDRVPQTEHIMLLTVEPTFLGSLANHIRDTTDPVIVGLKSRAGSIDGGFRFVVVGGHAILQRSSPAGNQLVILPEGGLWELLMHEVHSTGHFGLKQTLLLLQ